MASSPTYDELLARLGAVERLLDSPSALKQRLEFGWDPRGGEPRIIDEDGNTLDFQGAIQLMGGTSTVDPQAQRVIYTPSGGAGLPLVGNFSDDATVTDDERLRFVGEAAPATVRAALSTSTNGAGTRRLELAVSEADPYNDPRSLLVMTKPSAAAPTTVGQTQLRQRTFAGSLAGLDAQANETGTSVQASLGAFNGVAAQAAQASLQASGGTSGHAEVVANAQGSAPNSAVYMVVDGSTRQVLTGDLKSTFMQARADTTTENEVRRVTRGPFTVAVAALAAGASTSGTLTNARTGSAYVVVGGADGAAGSETLLWSWTSSGANDVTVNVTNVDLLAARTATLRFYVIDAA